MASGALIIGFNVRANPQAREIAKRDKVDIRYYIIIYERHRGHQGADVGLLDPTYKETFLGNAEIREVFRITKVGNVAGCMVTDGMVKRGAKVRLLRDNVVIHEGTLKSLKRFKDDVREVQHGFECGMAFENYNDIKVGDVIECFEVEEVARRSRSLRPSRARGERRGSGRCPDVAARTRQSRAPASASSASARSCAIAGRAARARRLRDPDLRGASITVTEVDVSPTCATPPSS